MMFANDLRLALQKVYLLYHSSILIRTPVLIYQMGKVGSSSIYQSLRQCGCRPVFHVHRINPWNIGNVAREHIRQSGKTSDERIGIFLYYSLFKKKNPVKIITAIRDPVARNISAFFQNLEMFASPSHAGMPHVDDLIARFIAEYPHKVPLKWFDDELKVVSGIDIFSTPFPKEDGLLEIENGPFRALFMKVEIDDVLKEKAVQQFTGIKNFRLVNRNIGQKKAYGSVYQQFVKRIRLPEEYLDRMVNSRFTRHFYTETEIEQISKRWKR